MLRSLFLSFFICAGFSANCQISDTSIFRPVETEASFPGGKAEWTKYLQKNLNADVAVKKKAPAGSYEVVIQFIVNKDGTVDSIKALTNHGYGMEEEAMRVIRKGPKWTPAFQNGKIVRAFKRQSIIFFLPKE